MKTTANQQLVAIHEAIFAAIGRSYDLRKQAEAIVKTDQARATKLIDAAIYGDEQAAALGDAMRILSAVYRAHKAAQELDALLASVPQPAPEPETDEADD